MMFSPEKVWVPSCIWFVWPEVQAGRFKKVSSLDIFNAITVEYIIVHNYNFPTDYMCLRTTTEEKFRTFRR